MKRRLYPSHVKVGKHRYRIDLVPFIEEIAGNITRGYCDHKAKVITLLTKQTDKELFSTFVHELLHAIEHEYKVRIPHKLVYAQEGPLSETLLRNFHLLPRR